MQKNKFFLVLSLIFLNACFSKQEQTANNPKEFNFAASGEFKPFSFVSESGELTGFDIEVGQALAREMGLEPKAHKYKFPALIEGIKSGRFDAAVASHTVTAARQEQVNFSKPYYYSGPRIFVRPGSQLKTGTDLKGKEVAVSKGSSYADEAVKWTDKIKVYDSDLTALDALERGHHDAVITDFVTGATAIKSGLKLEERELLGRSEQAVALAKDRPELLEKVNQALDRMHSSGILKELSMKYFNRDITIQPTTHDKGEL